MRTSPSDSVLHMLRYYGVQAQVLSSGVSVLRGKKQVTVYVYMRPTIHPDAAVYQNFSNNKILYFNSYVTHEVTEW